jgi:hypothetical protein
MLERFIRLLTSLKLTVACLGLAVVLVFFGTLAQQHLGLFEVQKRYFQSFFVWWGPPQARWEIPIFPGGYLLGGLLLINLVAAYIRRGMFTWDRAGLLLTHGGLILLLAGQLLTDRFSRESAMRFAEGEARNYTDAFRDNELVVTDKSDPKTDLGIAVPERALARRGDIRLPGTPLTLRVVNYWPNADVAREPQPGSVPSGATQGLGVGQHVVPRESRGSSEEHTAPVALVEIRSGSAALGTWLAALGVKQGFTYEQKPFELEMRPVRFYTPFSVTLLRTTHEVYPGTDIPKNFQSRVRIEHPGKSETREVDIYMNNPLRYEGLTFYQYQMGRDELDANRGTSVLQVVRNPGWLTPYLGCVLVGLGLTVQFLMHLIGFVRERRSAA